MQMIIAGNKVKLGHLLLRIKDLNSTEWKSHCWTVLQELYELKCGDPFLVWEIGRPHQPFRMQEEEGRH